MDQAGKKGGFGDREMGDTAGLNEKMENLFNGDSLTKGLELADSALKNLNPEKLKELKEAMKDLEKLKDQ
jgi:hypothetical protein